jgi:hypothetical protein
VNELRDQFTALKTATGSIDLPRLRYIESLLSRAEQAEGPLASLLQAKVRDALKDYRARAARQQAVFPQPIKPRPDTGLRDLVALLNECHANDDDPNVAPLEHRLRQQELEVVGEMAGQALAVRRELQPRQEELRAARRLQSAMVRQNADKVLTQALAEIPEECGPLNPQRLATRSLQAMHDLSPHYLSRFVSYIDTLFWLENADKGR